MMNHSTIALIESSAAHGLEGLPEKERAERLAAVKEAATWLGTPYHHHGRVKGSGTDCAMYLIEVFTACGLMEPWDPGHYATDWHLHHSEELYLGHVQKYAKPVFQPLPGDIALFQFGRTVSHGALVVKWPFVLHAYVGLGVIFDQADKGELERRYKGSWSLWGGR